MFLIITCLDSRFDEPYTIARQTRRNMIPVLLVRVNKT